jgi:hypothetical protein
MAKQLKDLLGEFQFNNSDFDPNKVKADMLSSKEVGPTTGNINIPAIGLNVEGVKLPYDRQYQKLAENVVQIYGVDSARILTRGAVEPMQLAKRGVDRLSRIALGGTFGNNTALGGFLRNSLNSFTNPQYPSDEVNDLPGLGPSTKNGLYGSLFHGGVNNNKNAIGNLLTSFATPNQIKQNIGSIESGKVKIGGAAIDMALNVGFSALQSVGKKFGLNAKRGGGNDALSEIKNPLNTKDNDLPIYPSDYAIKSFGKSTETLTGIATGLDQLMREGERFYTKYEGINAEKELKTIKLDGKKYTSLKPGLGKFIKTIEPFPGYRTYDDGNGTKYKIFNIDTLSVEEIERNKFSKQVYDLTIGPGGTSEFTNKNVINTKLFAGRIKRQNFTNNTNSGIEGGIGAEQIDTGNKNHRTLSNLAIESYSQKNTDLIEIFIRDIASQEYIILMSNLTGLTDTPTPTWGDVQAVGSPNKFYFYQSFEREISFKGQMYAKNEKQLIALWTKIEKLQRLTLATPGGTAGIKGKICKLKIGNLVSSEYGFLTNCTITIPDNSPWEIQTDSQVPFICEFDITYKVIYNDNTFNNITESNIPEYEYLDATLPGLNFSKPLQPGNNDIKKLQGLGPFFGKQGSGETTMEGTINQNSFTGGETSTSEVPNILEPQSWQMQGSGEAPNGSGIFNTIGTDTTDELIPTSDSGNKSNSNEFKINPSSTPKWAKQKEYDPKTGDYKKNIFGKDKLFKVRGVDNIQN